MTNSLIDDNTHMPCNLFETCNGFRAGDKVRTRGDMGSFNLTVVKVHNHHYATCRGYGKDRHLNMNILEKV